ncbi:hypothetical protein TV39_19480 [Arthrobacter sp. SPG23]|uniref:type IV toxin-antitoxin system AbiEi family antitoxin domain-containing protein n=1 Tax=Arthrobacter sp. SPG23 TaxID=1610703 RepID=UPI0005B79B92|nr:type IV toxin-antitoxin system AbiEi family antitoxin domain-containing protein [Arthrobacter sp. SPG23]KIS25798.1 hypothetical protein TV39_19480 [Arthrobacter sp. SPG23]
MDLLTYLRHRGGAARRSQLLAAGFKRPELEAAVAAGRLMRPLRGIYTTTTADDGVVAAFRSNGRLTCISAAPFYNLWALHPARALHLSCGNGVPKPGVVDHSPCTHPRHPYLPVAGLADVLIHALRCLPEPESLVMVQSAAQRGDITAEFLRKKLPGKRNGRARAVLDLLIPRADSLLEILAHTHFVRAGLNVRMHVELPGVGEVDCLVDDWLVVELDGASHFESGQIKKDHRRSRASMLGGRLTLHYCYEDVVRHPQAMVDEIRAILRLRAEGRFAHW